MVTRVDKRTSRHTPLKGSGAYHFQVLLRAHAKKFVAVCSATAVATGPTIGHVRSSGGGVGCVVIDPIGGAGSCHSQLGAHSRVAHASQKGVAQLTF